MLERSLEILVRLCAPSIFGPDWELRAQQLTLAKSGRIDLLFSDSQGALHVLEVKKGRANTAAIQQVLRYAEDLRTIKAKPSAVIPWVVAHEVPKSVQLAAKGQEVRFVEIPMSRCTELIQTSGITAAELSGRRRDGSVVFGGGTKMGLWSKVDLESVLAEMPPETASLMRSLNDDRGIAIASGAMQTVLHYKGAKLGGINRKHRGGTAYIATGVILTDATERALMTFGFKRMTKIQSSKHEHVWWETSWSNITGFRNAIELAKHVVDEALLDAP